MSEQPPKRFVFGSKQLEKYRRNTPAATPKRDRDVAEFEDIPPPPPVRVRVEAAAPLPVPAPIPVPIPVPVLVPDPIPVALPVQTPVVAVAESLCVKYAPKTVSEVTMSPKHVSEKLRAWIVWRLACSKETKNLRKRKPSDVVVPTVPAHFKYQSNGKVLTLHGPSGCGKRALVHAIAKELRCGVTEPPGVDSIQSLLRTMQDSVCYRGFEADPTPQIWLFAGVDGYAASDGEVAGSCMKSMDELLRVWTESKLKLPPIVLTVRDFDSPVMHALRVRNEVPTLYMEPVRDCLIKPVLEKIAIAEKIDTWIVKSILDTFSGDIRAAITELHIRGGRARRSVSLCQEDMAVLITVRPDCIFDFALRSMELFFYGTYGRPCSVTKRKRVSGDTFVLVGFSAGVAELACRRTAESVQTARLAVWNDVLDSYVAFLKANVKSKFDWSAFPVSSLTHSLTSVAATVEDRKRLVDLVGPHLRLLGDSEDALPAVLQDIAGFRLRLETNGTFEVKQSPYKYDGEPRQTCMRYLENIQVRTTAVAATYAKDHVPDTPFLATRVLMDVSSPPVQAVRRNVEKRPCLLPKYSIETSWQNENATGKKWHMRPVCKDTKLLQDVSREDLDGLRNAYDAFEMTPWLMWFNGYDGLSANDVQALPEIADCWSLGDYRIQDTNKIGLSAEAATLFTLGKLRTVRRRSKLTVPTTRTLNASRNERMKPFGGAMLIKTLRSDCLETVMHSNLQVAEALELMRLKAGQWQSVPEHTNVGLGRPLFPSNFDKLALCLEDAESTLETIVGVAAACFPDDIKPTDDFTLVIDVAAHYSEAWQDEDRDTATAVGAIAKLGVRVLGGDPLYVPEPLPRHFTMIHLGGAKKDPFYRRMGFKRENLDLFMPLPPSDPAPCLCFQCRQVQQWIDARPITLFKEK